MVSFKDFLIDGKLTGDIQLNSSINFVKSILGEPCWKTHSKHYIGYKYGSVEFFFLIQSVDKLTKLNMIIYNVFDENQVNLIPDKLKFTDVNIHDIINYEDLIKYLKSHKIICYMGENDSIKSPHQFSFHFREGNKLQKIIHTA